MQAGIFQSSWWSIVGAAALACASTTNANDADAASPNPTDDSPTPSATSPGADTSDGDTPDGDTPGGDTPGADPTAPTSSGTGGVAPTAPAPAAGGAPAEGMGGTSGVNPQPNPSEPGDSSTPTPTPIPTPEPSAGNPSEPADAGDPAPGPTEPEGETPSELDPLPGEYATRRPLLEPNSEMAVAEVNGKIYVVGGYPASRQTQATVQVYDPVADEWALAAPHPEPIHHPVLVGAEGRLFSLGGQTDGGDSDRCRSYDPNTDAWSALAEMPTARGGGAGAYLEGKIYVVGGRPPANNAFEVYDIATNGWQTLTALPRDYDQRNHLAAVALGGKIYVAGGRYDGGGFQSPMTDVLDVYDPGTNAWTRAASMLRPRGGVNGVVAYGCFHLFGGEGTNTGEPNDVFPDHDAYDPTNDRWIRLAPLPTPVHGVTGAVFLNGLIYMPGGGTSSGGTSGSTILQVYRPELRCDGS